MRAVRCILIALIVASAGSLAADLCSWCNCSRGGKDGHIADVVCICQGEKHKSLVLDQASMKNLTDVQNISIVSCSSVELKPKAFSELLKFDTLLIDATEELIIADEVFNTLSILELHDVRNLTLNEKSLQNVKNLSNIFIKKIGIAMLPQGVFTNLPELAKLKLDKVTLGEVHSGAIQLSMNKVASVYIEHSEIGHIQEAGIVCSSINNFILINSTVKSAANNSISIVTHEAAIITGNTLERNVTSDSFNVTSKSVTVTGNTFTHFPAGLLPDNGMTVSFSDNKVLEPNWNLILPKSSAKITFINNRFSCNCSKKEKLTSKKDSVESESWLDTNYCLVTCNLSLKRLPETCQKVSDKDNEICKKIDNRSTTTTRYYLGLPGPDTTSAPHSKSAPTTTTSPHGGSGTILTSSLLSIALSSLIFTIL